MSANGEPRVSRQMVSAMWSGEDNAEEARALLQARIASLFKLMFWSIVAFIWRFWLVGPKPLSMKMLYRLDLVYSLGIGAAFGAAAYLQSDLRVSGYLSVVYTTFTVFARALIVPSSGKRTAVASSITMLPMTAAALALALTTPQDVPGVVYFVGFMLFCLVAITLSAAGSQIIYGLSQKVTAAKQLGSYTLDRKIGEGGMGVVYLAHHVMLRRPTAVKRVLSSRDVSADTLARFEREVQAMSQLTHPNTVAVYDYGRSPDGTLYYAMEYLGGGIDLQNLVEKYGPQPTGRVAQILAQVCGALHEAHSSNFIHRDIKPANILVCERGGQHDVAKVVDYGLVRDFAADPGTSTQIVLGTPAYLSPEAITDPSTIGPAADLYALGAVGYFLVTGKRVFTGTTAVDVCIAHVTKSPTPPSQVAAHHIAPELEAILLKCLAKKPADRFANAKELRNALLALAATDWTLAEAKEWWAAFRTTEHQVAEASDGETMTMSVDLAHHRETFRSGA